MGASKSRASCPAVSTASRTMSSSKPLVVLAWTKSLPAQAVCLDSVPGESEENPQHNSRESHLLISSSHREHPQAHPELLGGRHPIQSWPNSNRGVSRNCSCRYCSGHSRVEACSHAPVPAQISKLVVLACRRASAFAGPSLLYPQR
jgi:hypothetical protein